MEPRKPNSNGVLYSLAGYGQPEEIRGDRQMPDLTANRLMFHGALFGVAVYLIVFLVIVFNAKLLHLL